MKTSMNSFRQNFLSSLIVACIGLCGLTIMAQPTGSCTVIHQPCNGDAVVLVHTTGMTLPITFYCNDPYNTMQTIASGSDITFYNMEYFAYVTISDAASNFLTVPSGLINPFVMYNPILTPAICPNPGSATILINFGITPDYVEWYDDSDPFPGNYIGTGNPMSLYGGMYRTKVFYNGCYILWDSGYVFISSQSSITFNTTTTDANCTNGTAAVTNVNGGTPPYSYLWSNGSSAQMITGLQTGSYEVTVTDATGCSTSQEVYVSQSVQIGANPVITQIPTCLQNNGRVMSFGSGGTPPYSYLYSNGQTTQEAINLSGGTNLSVIVTDTKGCLGTGSVYLYSSTPIAVTYIAIPSLCTSATGSATLTITGGTGPYTTVWNTFPVQTGTTASNLPPGNYGFTVTDAAGCVQTGMAAIPPISIINAVAYSVDPVCPATSGTVGVYSSGTPPFSYLWNTGQTTPTITGVPSGFYSCVITDGNGCSVTKSTSVNVQSPITLGFSATPATCLYATDGILLAVPSGGTAPYSYSWSNGSTSNPATGLLPGWYSVTVTDADGCTEDDWSYVYNNGSSDACYCTIEGTVYYDANANCAADAGETGVEHIQVHLSPFGYTFTDNMGHYSFRVPSGNYTLSEVVQYTYPLTTPCAANDPVVIPVTASSGCTVTHDFFNGVNPLHDAHILTFNDNYPIPGNTYRQKLQIENDGTVTENDIYLNYYPDLQLGTFTTIPFSLNFTGSLWENPSLSISKAPGSGITLTNSFPVPTNMPLGTQLNYTDYVSNQPPISNWLNDYTPWNNINNFQTNVVGSYDPNYKEVYPKGTGSNGTISRNDSVLDYIVHFQNTGTYYAEKVVIIDTLDPGLDLASLLPGGSSHAYTADLSENGILTISFPNIHLTWESENELNSNGFVTYSMKQKPNLPTGTKIKNAAAIFFDYNAPVMTNRTLNTISSTDGYTVNKEDHGISVYPNPVSGILYVNTGESAKPKSLRISDISGRIVETGNTKENEVQEVDVKCLANGIYFIELIRAGGEKAVCRFVKN